MKQNVEQFIAFSAADGGPAHPLVLAKTTNGQGFAVENDVFPGLTIRDHFASHALEIVFGWVSPYEAGGCAKAANKAYEIADAMLAARKAGA